MMTSTGLNKSEGCLLRGHAHYFLRRDGAELRLYRLHKRNGSGSSPSNAWAAPKKVQQGWGSQDNWVSLPPPPPAPQEEGRPGCRLTVNAAHQLFQHLHFHLNPGLGKRVVVLRGK